MRKRVYPTLVLLVVLVIILLVFFLISRNTQIPSKSVGTTFNIQPVSKTNSFVGPVKGALDVTFQHAFDLPGDTSFSYLGIYDVTVKNVDKGKDSGYLEVVKEDKTLLLPLVGVLSFKKIGADTYNPVNVKDIGSIINTGDLITVHLMYVSPLSKDSTKQIREKLFANAQGEPVSDEARLSVNSITKTGLTENKILSMISDSTLVKFNATQMTVQQIELKSK